MIYRNRIGKYWDNRQFLIANAGLPKYKFAFLPVELSYPYGQSIWLGVYAEVWLLHIKGYLVKKKFANMNDLLHAQKTLSTGEWPFEHV